MPFDIQSVDPGNGRQFREDGEIVNVADKSEEYLGGKGMTVIADTVGSRTIASK